MKISQSVERWAEKNALKRDYSNKIV